MIISIIPNAVFADSTRANAPGGTVTTPEEFISALGGKSAIYEDGVITLINDVILAAPLTITSGSYVLMGEGAAIKGDFESGDIITVSGEGTVLAIGDKMAIENKRDIVFNGEGDKFVREGSLVRIEKGAKVEIYNSIVFENAATSVSGAAIYNEGEFVMYSGQIKKCRAAASGGAIFSSGRITLASGEIIECSANHGGAVYTEGEALFAGTAISSCTATNGGAIFNAKKMQFLSSEVTECKASKGGAIYNSGNAEILGGSITQNSAENGDGGGVYNTSELTVSSYAISVNSAKNGGNVYNDGKFTSSGEFSLIGGVASANGGNVYNSENGVFDMAIGIVTLGRAVYGAGVYNLGDFIMCGGVYANKSSGVADGVLNHGKLTLSTNGFCEKKDDIFVVITPQNKHAVIVSEEWVYAIQKVSVSCGVYEDGVYKYSHTKGNKLLDIKGSVKVKDRFMLHIADTGLVLNNDGTLVTAPTTVSETLITVICIILAFPLVTAAMVFAIRYFDKKKLAR